MLEREIPQLQEIAGKVWKKEDELKQLKSELAALDRKIQLELAPPIQETGQEQINGEKEEMSAVGYREHQSKDFIRNNIGYVFSDTIEAVKISSKKRNYNLRGLVNSKAPVIFRVEKAESYILFIQSFIFQPFRHNISHFDIV